MEVKHVLLFFLSQGTICSRVFAAGEDFTSRSGYFITRENKRFVGYVVKRFVSASFMSCSQSCLRNPWCSSTNFKVSSEMDGKGTCELNKHGSSLINENTKLNEERGITFSMLKVRILKPTKFFLTKTGSFISFNSNLYNENDSVGVARGVLPGSLGRGVRPASKNPYSIYDQNLRFSLPYL